MVTKVTQDMVEVLSAALEDRPTSTEVDAAIAGVSPYEVGDYLWSARATKPKFLKCDGAAYSRETHAALFAEIGTRYGAGNGSTTFNVPNVAGRALIGAGTGSNAEAVAAAAVNATTDVITVGSNADRWNTGAKVRVSSSATMPGGLAINTDYFVIRMSATTIKLATTLANAVAGTAINITTAGTGTHTITQALATRVQGGVGGEETHVLTVGEMPGHTHPGGGTSGAMSYTPGDGSGPTLLETSSTGSAGGSGAHNVMQPYLVENLFIYSGV